MQSVKIFSTTCYIYINDFVIQNSLIGPIRLGGGVNLTPLKISAMGSKITQIMIAYWYMIFKLCFKPFWSPIWQKMKNLSIEIRKIRKKIENFWSQKFRVRHARYSISTPGTRCTRLKKFLKSGYIYNRFCVPKFVEVWGGQFDPPPWDFGRKGPEWPPNGSNGRKTSYFDE